MQGRDLLHRHAEHLRGRGRVDVHRRRRKASLHVRRHRRYAPAPAARSGCSRRRPARSRGLGTNILRISRAQIRAHRDVLQVGLRGGEPPRRRDHVLEGGVNPPVAPDHLHQAVGIGGFQLGQHPVVHEWPGRWGACFSAFPALPHWWNSRFSSFSPAGRPSFSNSSSPSCLGGVDVELPRRHRRKSTLAVGNPPGKHIAEAASACSRSTQMPRFSMRYSTRHRGNSISR